MPGIVNIFERGWGLLIPVRFSFEPAVRGSCQCILGNTQRGASKPGRVIVPGKIETTAGQPSDVHMCVGSKLRERTFSSSVGTLLRGSVVFSHRSPKENAGAGTPSFGDVLHFQGPLS